MARILKIKDEDGKFTSLPYVKGENGLTPFIGQNGNWWIGETDTGVNASGEASSADCNIPKFVGTEENPIDFSTLFESPSGGPSGYAILSGYIKYEDSIKTIGEIISELITYTIDEILVGYTYFGHDVWIVFYSVGNYTIAFTAGYGDGLYGAIAVNEIVSTTSVLTKDNTTAYTPEEDYHPATKKYVDDTVAGMGTGGSGESVVIVPYAESYAAGTEEYNKIKSCFDENGEYVKQLYIHEEYFYDCMFKLTGYYDLPQGQLLIFSDFVYLDFGEMGRLYGTIAITVDLTDTEATMKIDALEAQPALTFDTTPTTGSENPVTSDGIKKYVDDTVANAGGGSSTYTLPAVGESQTIETLYGDYTLTSKETKTRAIFNSTLVSENVNVPGIKGTGILYTASLENTAFNLTLNGVTKTITFGAGEGNFTRSTDIASIFQEKINEAFGENQIEVSASRHMQNYDISFYCADKTQQVIIIISSIDGDTLTEAGMTDALAADKLNIESGTTNVFDTSITITEFTGTTESTVTITINEYTTTVSTSISLKGLFDIINNSENYIEIKYDFPHNVFTITDIATQVSATDTINLFSTMGFSTETAQTAEDACFVDVTATDGTIIKDVQLATNTFSIDGVLGLLTILQQDNQTKIESMASELESIKSAIIALGGTL